MDCLKWMLGLIGHVGLFCVLYSRIHATAWPRPTRKLSEKVIFLAVLLPIVWVSTVLVFRGSFKVETLKFEPITYFYFHGCLLLGVYFVCTWTWRKLSLSNPVALIETKTEWLKAPAKTPPMLHGGLAKVLGRIPFNEALKLTRQRMTLALDVPAELDGLKICQLSDLHFTGQIDISYFQRVVEEANEFQPDLVFITGDIIDKPECLNWIKATIGKLQAKLGVYYVLGNHDRRIEDEEHLRKCIADAGLIQASANWHQTEYGGVSIQITGNELPWYRDAESLADQPDAEFGLRILLSHSPDQLDWALARNFDLMFAGHTHGGQIALPFFGPLVAPSKYGVQYASGTFQIGKLLMHVSRGISGDEPIRLCSPPELGLFTIRSNELVCERLPATVV